MSDEHDQMNELLRSQPRTPQHRREQLAERLGLRPPPDTDEKPSGSDDQAGR